MTSRLNVGVCLLAFAMLHANTGNAQLLNSVGAKGAFSWTKQDFNFTTFDPHFESITAFGAALFAEWLEGMFSLVTQCEYAQRGMRVRYVKTGPTGPEPLGYFFRYNRVNYISIPVLAKVRILDHAICPFVLAGPRIDFMLQYRSDNNEFNVIYDKFEKVTYGVTAGAGVELTVFQNLPILLEGRYNLDLKDSFAVQNLRVRNRSIDIWLGIAFRI